MQILKIRQANINDKKIIINMILELDEYHFKNCSSFNKELINNYKENYIKVKKFIKNIKIEDFYILELNNKHIGTMMVWDNNGETTIINFYIYKNYRGKGYGRKFLNYIIKNVIKTNYFVLCVYKENYKARKFYKKFGFKFIQTEKTNYGIVKWLRYNLKKDK